jgi:NAD(P)-dependent dehydrogenase (short-subunit alcohol dehydrogenase family)
MLLKDKVAIVTGASQGVGQGIANVLAREGAKVVICNRHLEKGRPAVDLIQSRGGEAMAYQADVTKMDQVKAMVEATLKTYRRLDILVNNAISTPVNRPFAQTTEEDWEKDLGAGLRGYLVCTRAVINHFLAQKKGRIINISSSAGKIGTPNLAVYSAAKGAIITFTKVLALELAQTGVTVNSVAPGAVNTPLQAYLSDELKAFMLSTIPMRRYAEPEEIGEMVAFLASDRTDYITGQTYSVDGARTVQ